MELLLKYFPDLTADQVRQFSSLRGLYAEWNARINVVSRKDIDGLYLRHVLHSLAIARACRFADGARVMDIGTGGGYPAVPLAIMFPGAHFTAVDSVGKKIMVVGEVCRAAVIGNVTPLNARAESVNGRFDYVVSRAVTDTATLLKWTWGKIERGQAGSLPNGMLLLKGGDLDGGLGAELAAAGRKYVSYGIGEWFEEEFFEGKKVIYIGKSR